MFTKTVAVLLVLYVASAYSGYAPAPAPVFEKVCNANEVSTQCGVCETPCQQKEWTFDTVVCKRVCGQKKDCECAPGYRRDLKTGFCISVDECIKRYYKVTCGTNEVLKTIGKESACYCIDNYVRNASGQCVPAYVKPVKTYGY